MLGAAMWQQPHILVLDEPTNYLDRESLGAMASALKVRARGGGCRGGWRAPSAAGPPRCHRTTCSSAPLPADPAVRSVPSAWRRSMAAVLSSSAITTSLSTRCARRSGPWAAASATSPASLPRRWMP